jgi:hypothetical protein
MFDTLDARNTNRGEPHSQEFVIFPRGTDTDPNMPGIERVFESQRDAKAKEYRQPKASGKVFPGQPDGAPDGSGPYRVTRVSKDGYTVEVFLPRSVFATPVFAPGWYVGFDAVIAGGYQGRDQRRTSGWTWAGGDALSPDRWGDLLLLGTDARFIVQDASVSGAVSYAVIPGHSYLLTVVDPDRNVNLAAEDSVLVSAEVKANSKDVEVFILKEVGKNTGVFRGYVNTSPGTGRQYHGVLEVMPGDEVRFGYVDFANAKGERMVVNTLRLPVTTGLMRPVAVR